MASIRTLLAVPQPTTGAETEAEAVAVAECTANKEYDENGMPEAGIRPHPLGIRPSGNALTADENIRTHTGLFGRIPDGLVLTLLEWLDGSALIRLGATCRALYAYTASDQLWRDLWIAEFTELQMTWRGSWRATVLRLPSEKQSNIDCHNLFSDALHRPFLCSQIPLASYVSAIPSSNRIARFKDLSRKDFDVKWADMPFVLTEPVKQWPVFQSWSEAKLLGQHGQTRFRAEAVEWSLSTYIDYMMNNCDESPLYLFDCNFVQKMSLKVGPTGDYWPASCFGDDFFELLDDQRPDHRWLIVGPARSGSTFHRDPNATSAWNAVIRGSKYWIMFPKSIIPPGVYMSADESEVTSPLSIAEWLIEYHQEARSTPGCLEGICAAGEVLHVPAQWWHLVVNLDSAIAITQNFVPSSHLRSVIKFLKNKPEQISGFMSDIKDPYALFMDRLRAHHPELVENLQEAVSKKRKWEEVVQHESTEQARVGSGFSFGFDDDIEESHD